ncbi:sensor histidine kinase [Rhizobium sp. Leaf321]|uniref:sensor histidine kinase n=1 Tax=Rhizobium/Agrobacterium group TaxID=227290 RepID=UPI000AD15156|nr:HWE histidine kinase domain-containing protein [Rhizobium sp. Leaf321]
MQHNPRLLMLEDSPLDAELIREQLELLTKKPEIRLVSNRGEFVKALEARDFDLILSDFSLPDFDGMAALDMASREVPEIPFIFVSGILGEEAAIESFRRGATDYVLKQRLIRLPAAVERALAEAHEKAEHRRAQNQKELLVRELSHRVKNTMAMVMSLVRRTAKSSHTVDDYASNLLGRLRAMADAHALLFETNWSKAELADVVRRTLAPYMEGRGNRFVIDPGPTVHLDPKSALALSLVFNELTTNAVKYGGLSQDGGHIAISWVRDAVKEGKATMTLTWQEIGGPTVTPPEQQGFGTTLVERSIQYELRGNVEIDYAETGLVCRITFPIPSFD